MVALIHGHPVDMVCGLFTLNLVKQNQFVHGQMESPNTSPQVVELNPRYSGQTHANRIGTGPEYKDMEPGSILTVLCIPFMVCPLSSADAKSSKVVQIFCTAGTIGHLRRS